MRIVHVVETLERGGLERMVCDLASEQRRRGDEVSVVCIFRQGLLARELLANGVSVFAVGKVSGVSLGAVLRLRRMVRLFNADIIHTHNATAHYQVVAATVAMRAPPIVNTRHGMGGFAKDRREKLFRLALRRTSSVVVVCSHAAERFVSDGIVPRDLIKVIRNGIKIEKFAFNDRLAARRALGVMDHCLVAGIVGRLNWAKNHELLIDAFALVHRCIPDARLVVIGDGELRDAIEARIDERALRGVIELLGDRDDVADLLAGLDLFVLSSKTEGYSIALLEASASGLPIVTTDVGGNREIVQQGATGLLVRSGDARGLADALVQLLSDAPLRRRMSEEARSWAARHASVASMMAAYDDLYGSIMRGQIVEAATVERT